MVSIIVPCYNCERFVHRAIDSVLKQTFVEWELLLVNNNSTDGTQHVLETFSKSNPEKISVFQQVIKGAPAARNKGLENAKGKWIQYLDADDELLPEKLEQQVKLAEDEEADCVIGNAFLIEEKNATLHKSLRPLYKKDIWIGLIKSHLGITSSILWKRKALEEINGWNEKLTSSQEYDLMFRLMKSEGKVVIDDNTSTLIYKSDSSISKNPDKSKVINIIDNRVKLRLQILDYLTGINQLTEERKTNIFKYIFLELTGNKINIREYELTKLEGKSLKFPFKLRLNHFIKSKKRLVINSIKSLIKS